MRKDDELYMRNLMSRELKNVNRKGQKKEDTIFFLLRIGFVLLQIVKEFEGLIMWNINGINRVECFTCEMKWHPKSKLMDSSPRLSFRLTWLFREVMLSSSSFRLRTWWSIIENTVRKEKHKRC